MTRSYGVTNVAPWAAPPAVGPAGDTYYNTANKTMYVSDGTQWNAAVAPGSTGIVTYPPYKTKVIPINTMGAAGTGSIDIALTSGAADNATYDGWIEVIANGGYAGFSTGNVQPRQALYTNGMQDPNGSGYASFGALSGVINSGAWGSISDVQYIMPISAGASPALTWRGAWTPATYNCYFIVTSVTLKYYATNGQIVTQGATGPQGPDVTQVQSSYFYGLNTMGTGIASLAFGQLSWSSVLANNISLGAGTGLANGAIVFSQTGRYLIKVALGLSANATNVGTVVRFNHYNSVGGLKVQRDTFGNAVQNGQFSAADGSILVDAVAGDYIQIYVQPNGATMTIDASRSWVEVVPVGGVQGPVGPSGGPVPTGGAIGQIIRKTGSADFAVSWDRQAGQVVAWKKGNYNPLTVTSTAAVNLFTLQAVPMLAAHIYLCKFFIRAFYTGNDWNNYIRVQATNPPNGYMEIDAYFKAGTPYGSMTGEAIVTVSADANYDWAITGIAANTNNATIYTNLGGFILMLDLGVNPGGQSTQP